MNISVIIPTLNEERTLGRLLVFLHKYPGLEIIVADGGSTDQTCRIAGYYGVKIVTGESGRGRQLNNGAGSATGDILLFLHSDTFLPPDFTNHISALVNLPGTSAGAFRLRINAYGRGYRLIEWGANLRSTLLQMPYGDQAIFLNRHVFLQVGGFPDHVILEDIELVRRLKKHGKIRIAAAGVLTSPRRWQKLGLVRTTLLNQVILSAYLSGVDPEKLARLYYKNTADEH